MDGEFGSSGTVGWVGPPRGWPGEVHAAVSLRTGGVSLPPFEGLNMGRSAGDAIECVSENERIWSRGLGLPGPPARAKLAHACDVVQVDAPGVYSPFDALLTGKPGLPLWLTVADCFPLFLAVGEWIALVHCGWRGTADGAAGIAARALAAASGRPAAEIHAWIGPGIGSCCYPVGEEVVARFARDHLHPRDERIHLDLASAIETDLRSTGLCAERIGRTSLCTACHPELFFSYRRDGARSGRMAAVIWR
jgi:polyphenol oxidase